MRVGKVTFMEVSIRMPIKDKKPVAKIANLVFQLTVAIKNSHFLKNYNLLF